MAIFKRKFKILLYGDIHGAYRSENLIKFLLDAGYCISFVHPDFYCRGRVKKTFLTKVLRKVFSKFHLLELLVKAALSDVIYILPMNTDLIQNSLFVSRLFDNKLIVEPYALRYETRVKAGGEIAEGSRQAKEIMNQDILSLTQSDYIVHLSNHELACWQTVLGISLDPQKVFIAPLFSESRPTLTRKFMQDGILRICWWGTLLPLHGVDHILQAMANLQQQAVPFTCHLFGAYGAGYAQRFNDYQNRIQQAGLAQQVFLSKDLKFSDGSLSQYLSENCDLALGIFGDNERARSTAAPNKLIEALSMGIPTLTMNSPGLKEFFDPELDFWTCEPSAESLTTALLAILNGTAQPIDWECTRQKVLQTFSLARYQEAISKILNEVESEFLAAKNSHD